MRSRPGIGGIFRAQETCLVVENVVLPAWGANRAPPIPYLDFRGHFEAGKRGKGREGGKRKGRKGMEGTVETATK